MLHEIGVELGAALAAVGCPLKVIDGPEPTKTTTFARERIVVEHDGGDGFGPTRSQRPNPKVRLVRTVGAKVTIHAQSPKPNALDWEHRRRAEHVLDLVLVALEKVIVARKNAFAFTGGRFVKSDDLAKSETAGGAVYELTFNVERAVHVQNFDGSIRTEVTGIPISGTDLITTANGPDDQAPETNC